MRKITDIDLVRWAFVEVLIISPEYQAAETEKERKLIIDQRVVELISASPEELQQLLFIRDFEFAREVHAAIKANEKTRRHDA